MELSRPAPVAEHWVEVALPLPVGQTLTYSLTSRQRARAGLGCRVRVPVGARREIGYVVGFSESAPVEFVARPIGELLDREPPIPPDLLELAHFTASYYLAPIGDVLAAMSPPAAVSWGELRVRLTDGGALTEAPPSSGETRLRDLLLEHGRLTFGEIESRLPDLDVAAIVDEGVAQGRLETEERGGRGSRYLAAAELAPGEPETLRALCGRSAAGRAVVDFLSTIGRAALASEVESGAGCGPGVLRRLAELGVIRRFTQPVALSLGRHRMGGGDEPEPTPITLRADQVDAERRIAEALESGQFQRFLLQGMTGSGKTEVYLRAASRCLDSGRSAVLLVPEIALVPALASAARRRFGSRVAVLHSGLGEAERSQEWERIRRGEASVVVGARSALFAPVSKLGLIVVDEEQDTSYKQDAAPRYHGRDLALARAKFSAAVAILVSATPALETRLAADQGRVERLRLTERAGKGGQVEGILVDLRDVAGSRKPGEIAFSDRLITEIDRTLVDGDQIILLRNRRGYAPLLLCRACGEEFRCEPCGLPRTLHRRADRLLCHYCGSSLPVPARCPACRGETLEPVGAGTERVEEDLAERFPGVPIDVLDRDSARRRGGPAAILERFARGETRILVGTQMISKGHHFPGVALTAVLSADGYLGFPDFRAVEKTYALLTQIAGRSGRGDRPGRVVVQTFLPDHYAIRAALERDDEAFAEQELRFRRAFHYPPYTRMVQILSRDRGRERALARLEEIAGLLSRRPEAQQFRVTGPAPAPFERLRGEWRFQLLVRSAQGALLRRALRELVGDRPAPGLAVDVDPYQLL